jgi:hypothetical protein
MTDYTSNTPVTRHKPPRTEFMIYFAIVFLATLPLATLTWALAAIRAGNLTEKGPHQTGLEPGADHHTDDLLGLSRS